MGHSIFISYRRDDSRQAAGRLGDELARRFGEERIFRDIESIDPGVDFEKSLESALKASALMLVLIGPHWLDMRNPAGERRLDDPTDWIRREIESALQRNIRTVPVLLDDTVLPRADQLPPGMRSLTARQSFELSDDRWRGDIERLTAALAKVVPLLPPAPAQPPMPPPARAHGSGPAPEPPKAAPTGIAGWMTMRPRNVLAALACLLVGWCTIATSTDTASTEGQEGGAPHAVPGSHSAIEPNGPTPAAGATSRLKVGDMLSAAQLKEELVRPGAKWCAGMQDGQRCEHVYEVLAGVPQGAGVGIALLEGAAARAKLVFPVDIYLDGDRACSKGKSGEVAHFFHTQNDFIDIAGDQDVTAEVPREARNPQELGECLKFWLHAVTPDGQVAQLRDEEGDVWHRLGPDWRGWHLIPQRVQ